MLVFNSINSLKISLIVTGLLLSGCSVQDNRQYYWGNYEKAVYAHHLKSEEISLSQEIETITQDIDQASITGKPVPPGVYAHLGMLYASSGDLKSAVDALNREKQAFPESEVLINGFIQRLKSNEQITK